jgi:peptidoglycan/LPS O-acetylase OafA/YrhL
MSRIPSLDGVRAIAILLVIAGHWTELAYDSPVAGAFASLGRRIFFVLSGYLITTLLIKEYGKSSTIQLRRFYLRRAYRILPAALAFMLPVFAIFWHELRWYQIAAAAFYVVNMDFTHPWFIGHLWSISVQEQFYFVWPCLLRNFHQHRVPMLLGAIAFAPVYRVACHFAGLHGRADETFPAIADILAIGCLLALYGARLPRVKAGWALLMLLPVVLVPIYMGVLRFHTTPLLLLAFWPALHLSIAGLLLHVVQTPYRILNVNPVTWVGKISYGLYLWQQLFVFGHEPRPWYFVFFAFALASASYYLLEQPVLRFRERKPKARIVVREFASAA